MPRMRNGALGLVAVLAGCNQVWGNDPVQRWDAPSIPDISPEAPLPTARLELLVAMTDNTGAATNAVEMHWLDPAPTVQIGRIDGALMQATYDQGVIRIPADYPGTPWRLVYTLSGDIPHEVHWVPGADVEGRAVVAQFGSFDRAEVPANASYRLSPTVTGAYTDLHVYTTGVWGNGIPSVNGTIATQAVNPTDFKVISGPLLAPDDTKGDRVVLLDYQGTYPCQQTHGTAMFKIALTGPDSPGFATWKTDGGGGIEVTGYAADTASRVADRYGPGVQPGDVTSQAIYGYGVSTVMPMFVTRHFASALYAPAMIPLVNCFSNEPLLGTKLTTSIPFADLEDDMLLPVIANVQLGLLRGLPNGIRVYNGLTGAIATTTGQQKFDIQFPVGIPLDMQIDGQAVGGQHILNEPDHVQIPSGTGATIDLTFALDSPIAGQTMGIADYATATLYRYEPAAPPVRIREYTFTGPSDPEERWTLQMDRAVFTSGTEYVIELRTFAGAPGAPMADFTRYASAQSSATRWTRTFITP